MKLNAANQTRSRSYPSLGWRAGVLAFLLGTVLCAMPGMVRAQSDNFNDGNDDGWRQYDPIADSMTIPGVGDWSFPGGNTYRIQTSVPLIPNFGPGRAGSLRQDTQYGDFYMTVDLVSWNTNLDQSVGLVARIQEIGLGQTDGYALTYTVQDKNLDLTRFTNENPNGGGLDPIDGSNSVEFIPGRSYRIIWTGVGNRFTVRAWELPKGRFPVCEYTAVDPQNAYGTGYSGLIVFDNSGGMQATDATFDNFLVQAQAPPTLTIRRSPFLDVSVAWSTNYPNHLLQWSSVLGNNADWNTIDPPNYSLEGDQYTYGGDDWSLIPERSYRLFKPNP